MNDGGVIVLKKVVAKRAAALKYIAALLRRDQPIIEILEGLILVEMGPETEEKDRDSELARTLETMLERLHGGDSVATAIVGGVFPSGVVALLQNKTLGDLPKAFEDAAEHLINNAGFFTKQPEDGRTLQPT